MRQRLSIQRAIGVTDQRIWAELAVSAGRRDPIDEQDEFRDVVTVTGGESGGQRSSLTVADHVVLGARVCDGSTGRGLSFRSPLCPNMQAVHYRS